MEMKYLVQWTSSQESARAAAERFLQTGGKPPDGVTQLGRWFGLNGTGCARAARGHSSAAKITTANRRAR